MLKAQRYSACEQNSHADIAIPLNQHRVKITTATFINVGNDLLYTITYSIYVVVASSSTGWRFLLGAKVYAALGNDMRLAVQNDGSCAPTFTHFVVATNSSSGPL